jgi:adenosylmethionine-8-amino-7-oxononanoate aminotransferase
VAARTQQLGELLESLATQPHVAGVRQRGMLAAVELVSHPAEARIGHRIYQECLRRGAWLRPLGDTLVVMPPLAISEAELELLMSVLCESIVAVA